MIQSSTEHLSRYMAILNQISYISAIYDIVTAINMSSKLEKEQNNELIEKNRQYLKQLENIYAFTNKNYHCVVMVKEELS